MTIPADQGEIWLFRRRGALLGEVPWSGAESHPAASPSAPRWKHAGTKRVSLVLILQDGGNWFNVLSRAGTQRPAPWPCLPLPTPKSECCCPGASLQPCAGAPHSFSCTPWGRGTIPTGQQHGGTGARAWGIIRLCSKASFLLLIM